MKIFIAILFSLICYIGHGQTPLPYKTPYQQLGSKNVAVSDTGGLFVRETLTIPNYLDTNAANLSRARLYKGSYITVGNLTYQRSADITHWILIGGSSAACPGTQLISGSISWSGTGYIYQATNLVYDIICLQYSSAATTLTVQPADVTNPRIDKIFANTSGIVSIRMGVAAPAPQEPAINPLTEIDLGIIYVAPGSTTPSGTTQTVIYNENIEWVGTSNVPSINFTYATNPYIGTVSTLVPNAPENDTIAWQYGSVVRFDSAQYLKFWIRLNTAFSTDPLSFLDVSFYKNGTEVSQKFFVATGAYNFDATIINAWQLVAIPLTGIMVSDTTFNKVNFKIHSAPTSFQLDYVYILSTNTVPPIVNNGWQLTGNSGTNEVTNFTGTSDSKRWNWGTNNQIRAYIDSSGIDSLSNDDTEQQLLSIKNKKIFRTPFPTVFAKLPIVIEKSNDSTYIDCPTCSTGGGWSLTGNSGTTAGTYFLGTTDDIGLIFKVNNVQSGYINRIFNSTSLGYQSLLVDAGSNNNAFGNGALKANTSGSSNSAFGGTSLTANTTGSNNAAFGGGFNLLSNTTGSGNTGVGVSSLSGNTTGYNNTGVGFFALSGNGSSIVGVTTGIENTAVGHFAGVSVATNDSSIALGAFASADTKQLAISPYITNIKATGIPTAAGSVLTDVAGDGILTLQPGGGGTPNLLQVTAIDSITTHSIQVLGDNKFIGTGSNGVAFGGAFLTHNETAGGGLDLTTPAGSTVTLNAGTTNKLKISGYGSGTHTGTPTYGLSVDASGNVIETSGGGSSPAGNYDNIQINRNGVFDTPGGDSLSFDAGILNVKGEISSIGQITGTGGLNITGGSTINSNGQNVQFGDVTNGTYIDISGVDNDNVINYFSNTIHDFQTGSVSMRAYGAGVATFDASGNISSVNGTISNFGTIDYQTPTTGSTISSIVGSNIIEPAGALLALTVTLPASPNNGDIAAYTFTTTITGLTFTGGTVVNTITTAAAGGTIKFIYYSGTSKWYKWQ